MPHRRGCRGLSSAAALLVLSACGKVEPSGPDADRPRSDAQAADAAPSEDAAPVADAGPDCVVDSFTGAALAPHWELIIGALPTYAVDASRLLISDAPFAETATPPVSWITELDTDKGNQLGWAQDIADADFTITADLSWSSSGPELTFAGVAIANAQGMMPALVGVRDGSTSLNGYPNAQFLVRDAEDTIYVGEREEPGAAVFRMQRRDGVLRAYVDDVDVGMDASPQDVAYVSIFYLRHRSSAGTEYPFGSLEIRSLEVCRP